MFRILKVIIFIILSASSQVRQHLLHSYQKQTAACDRSNAAAAFRMQTHSGGDN